MARERGSHLWIHVGLISFTALTIYPVLWVLALAFSGQQSVGIIDLPKDPSFLECSVSSRFFRSSSAARPIWRCWATAVS